jgi:ribonucleoside-diphosphate reductase alpha chain
MYRHAWHAGLKTTYYLRTLGASNIEKATVGVKKEMRGAVSEGSSGGQNSGDVGGSHSVSAMAAAAGPSPSSLGLSPASSPKKEYSAEEKRVCSIEAMKQGEECEACQ